MPNPTNDFKDMDSFVHEQHLKHHCFVNMYFLITANKYKLCRFAEGLVGKVPDVTGSDTKAFKSGVPCKPIRDLFKNMYTFVDKNGHTYFCLMPDTELSVLTIKQRFLQNGIKVYEVTKHSPLGDALILIDSDDLMSAYE